MAKEWLVLDPITEEIHLKSIPESGEKHVIWTKERLVLEVDPTGFATDTLACAASNFVATGYLEAGYEVPTVGAYLYNSAEGNTGFGSSCPNYIAVRNGGITWALQVANGSGGGGEPCENPTGLIRTVVECS